MKKLITLSAIVLTALGASAGSVSAATYDTDASVKFKAGSTITKPVDPTDPGTDVVPVNPLDPDGEIPAGTVGPLSIDYASSIYFGEQEISSELKVYNAEAQPLSDGTTRPNYVQVTDSRGTEAGWSLQVKQNGQFKSVAKNYELTGAELTFSNAEVVTASTSPAPSNVKTSFTLGTDGTGVAETIMAAAVDEGNGTFVYRFGNDATKATSISLSVPGKTTKYADEYRTSLTWTLTDVPGNTTP